MIVVKVVKRIIRGKKVLCWPCTGCLVSCKFFCFPPISSNLVPRFFLFCLPYRWKKTLVAAGHVTTRILFPKTREAEKKEPGNEVEFGFGCQVQLKIRILLIKFLCFKLCFQFDQHRSQDLFPSQGKGGGNEDAIWFSCKYNLDNKFHLREKLVFIILTGKKVSPELKYKNKK